MSKHKTAKGVEFNMQAFASSNSEVVAIGNVYRNARGDALGPGGKIIASKQEIAIAAHNQASKRPVSTKVDPLTSEIFRKEIKDAKGNTHYEIHYGDGSVEVVKQEEEQPVATKKKVVKEDGEKKPSDESLFDETAE